MKALVYDKWELNFKELKFEKGSKGDNQSFIERLVKGEEIAADTVLANTMVLEKFSKTAPPGLDVVELYGGAGFQTLALEELLQPKGHLVVERDEYCVQHLQEQFPDVQVVQGNAEDYAHIKADYYALDSNGWTINTLVTNKEHNKDMWEKIFAHKPLAIQFWDSSKSYFMANKELYGNQLGKKITSVPEYAKALSEYFLSNYGYSAAYVCYARYSTYYLLQPGVNEMVEMKTSDATGGIKGFRWI